MPIMHYIEKTWSPEAREAAKKALEHAKVQLRMLTELANNAKQRGDTEKHAELLQRIEMWKHSHAKAERRLSRWKK